MSVCGKHHFSDQYKPTCWAFACFSPRTSGRWFQSSFAQSVTGRDSEMDLCLPHPTLPHLPSSDPVNRKNKTQPRLDQNTRKRSGNREKHSSALSDPSDLWHVSVVLASSRDRKGVLSRFLHLVPAGLRAGQESSASSAS